MTNPALCLTLCLSVLPAVAFAAAPTEHAVDTSTATAAAYEAAALPAADSAESLPHLPQTQLSVLSFATPQRQATIAEEKPSRISFTTRHTQGVSPLASMPLAGAARHLGAQRFNTDDGSMLDDFAICYRMSGRSSIEVIPGDPAPVKLPVVSMANNTGVTVGLVVRLSR